VNREAGVPAGVTALARLNLGSARRADPTLGGTRKGSVTGRLPSWAGAKSLVGEVPISESSVLDFSSVVAVAL
jgi:hypothetical protein